MKRYKVSEVVKLLETDGMVSCLLERRSSSIQTSGKTNKSDSKREIVRNSKSGEFEQYLETGWVEIKTN